MIITHTVLRSALYVNSHIAKRVLRLGERCYMRRFGLAEYVRIAACLEHRVVWGKSQGEEGGGDEAEGVAV